ncbi:MAG: hypothetical protein RIQ41_160 [Candidatus Parcubacteria bacterium]|jgi:hypothetical protein
MDETIIFNQLAETFGIQDLQGDDREELLFEISKTVHAQFLRDVYDIIGKEKFEALDQSASMGAQFYTTTIRHLVPNYEEVMKNAISKVAQQFHATPQAA